MIARNIWHALAVLLLAGIAPVHGFAESMSITVNGPDALRDVAIVLGARHGVAISYEGPEYSYPSDLVDHTRLTQPTSDELARCAFSNAFFARFCYFSSTYEVDAKTGDPPDITEALRTIIADYNRGENPGKFAVIETKAGPCIIPTAVRAMTGEWTPTESALSTRISVTLSNADNVEAINRVLDAVKEAAGVAILPGLFLMPRGGITMRVEDKPAREVLAELMKNPLYASTNECWEWFFAPCPPRFGYRNNAVVKGAPVELRDDYPWMLIGNVTHPDYHGESAAPAGSPDDTPPPVIPRQSSGR